MDAHGHRIWRYAGLAWIALVVVPIGYAAVRWQMGLGHDPDMTGVGELMLSMLVVILVPMAALAFGVLAPLAIGVDQLTNARTPRAVNVLIGAALSAPALVVTVVAVGWPEHGIRDALAALGHLGRAPGFGLGVLLAGIIVGFGLRYPAQPLASRRCE